MFSLVINRALNSLDVYKANGSKLFRAFTSVSEAKDYLRSSNIRGRSVDQMVKKFEIYLSKQKCQVQSFSGSLVENKGKRVVNPETGQVFVLGSRRGRLPGWVKRIVG